MMQILCRKRPLKNLGVVSLFFYNLLMSTLMANRERKPQSVIWFFQFSGFFQFFKVF